jgi:hypothetical protein
MGGRGASADGVVGATPCQTHQRLTADTPFVNPHRPQRQRSSEPDGPAIGWRLSRPLAPRLVRDNRKLLHDPSAVNSFMEGRARINAAAHLPPTPAQSKPTGPDGGRVLPKTATCMQVGFAWQFHRRTCPPVSHTDKTLRRRLGGEWSRRRCGALDWTRRRYGALAEDTRVDFRQAPSLPLSPVIHVGGGRREEDVARKQTA